MEERILVGHLPSKKKISDWFELHIINMRGKCVSKNETEAIEMSAETGKKWIPLIEKNYCIRTDSRALFFVIYFGPAEIKQLEMEEGDELLELPIPIYSYPLFASSTSAYYIVFVHRQNVCTGIIFL